MSHETTFHPCAERRRKRAPLIASLALAGGVLALILGGLAFALSSKAALPPPDRVQLLFVSGTPTRFSIRARLSRSGGGSLPSGLAVSADLRDARTGKQILQRQCGFSVNFAPDRSSVDVTIRDALPAGYQTAVPVEVAVRVRPVPLSEQFEDLLRRMGYDHGLPLSHAATERLLKCKTVLPPPSAGRE